MAGSGCQCPDAHCHFCYRRSSGDICRVCRDGYYLLDDACIESCPTGMASMGLAQFKRRCMAPFTCDAGRIGGMDVAYGCKCATDENTAAACRICDFQAGQIGQHCTRCNGGKFLHENRCIDTCDGLDGLIAYVPAGNYGRECRPPFTCTDRFDPGGDACKCHPSVGKHDCAVCDYGADGASCARCTNGRYLHNHACVRRCPTGTTAVGTDRDGRECQ